MVIKEIAIKDLKPYKNNPRKNDAAVSAVAKSIENFGFKVPIVIDSENVIVAGHTRYKAAQSLGIEKAPCVIADDLTDEQLKAFRLVDNKTSELSDWDYELLSVELSELENSGVDMADFSFDLSKLQCSEKAQELNGNSEISAEKFADDKFNCTCPRCGFKFNSDV